MSYDHLNMVETLFFFFTMEEDVTDVNFAEVFTSWVADILTSDDPGTTFGTHEKMQ